MPYTPICAHTYIECVSLYLHRCSKEHISKLSNGPGGDLGEGLLTNVLTKGLVQPLHTVAMLLCVLRDHGNDGAYQLLSDVAACLQETR